MDIVTVGNIDTCFLNETNKTTNVMAKSKFDSMDYSQFEAYLKEHEIEYIKEEGVDFDHWFTGWTSITPIESKIKKTRYFSRDGGHQLF